MVKKRIDDIEILRGIAVILVLIEHMNINLITWNTPMTNRFFSYFGGWTGVDLFFAISGFVIARDLIPKLQKSGDFEQQLRITIAFWIRRFWRLIPSAWFWLAVILVGSLVFNESGAWLSFRANFEGTVSAVLNVANLHIAHVFGRFESGVNFPYWSLSLEEQFYILLPFLVIFSKRWLPAVLAVVIVVQLLSPRDSLVGILIRTDALLLGVLIAIWAQHSTYKLFKPNFLKSKLARLILFGVLLVCLTTIGSDHLHMLELKVGVIALISAGLVFIASHNQDYILKDGILKTIMLWVGARSYALYLIHMPAYVATREIWFRYYPDGTKFTSVHLFEYLVTSIVLLVVLSELNYRLIENPLRKKGAKISTEFLAAQDTPAPEGTQKQAAG